MFMFFGFFSTLFDLSIRMSASPIVNKTIELQNLASHQAFTIWQKNFIGKKGVREYDEIYVYVIVCFVFVRSFQMKDGFGPQNKSNQTHASEKTNTWVTQKRERLWCKNYFMDFLPFSPIRCSIKFNCSLKLWSFTPRGILQK